MSITIKIAKRSTANCKNCGERIMADDVKLSIYSAHHAVSWCRSCGAEVLRILADRCENE